MTKSEEIGLQKKASGGNLKAINNTSSTNNIMLFTEAEKPFEYWTISDHVAFYLETHFLRGLNISPLPEDNVEEWGW